MPNKKIQNPKFNRKTALIVLIIGLLLLAFYKKNWFIAALVNNQPISNFEVLNRMNKQHRSQTIEQMVNEQLILSEAQKNKIKITPSDINNKISELEKNVGGAQALDNLLTQQGQTKASLKTQLIIQLSIEKLYASQATVSAQEVNEFIAQNQSQLVATDSAGQLKEAQESLKQQKLSQIFNEKFQQIKQSAKIQIF